MPYLPTSTPLSVNNQKGSPRFGEAGLAPVAIVIAVVVVLAAAGGYYFMSQNGSVPSLPGVPGGLTLNPNCKHNDPNLCKFLNNWKDMKQFSVKSQTSSKSGPKTEISFEINGEDRFHMMMSQGGKENWNVITMGDMMFTKDYSDNKWWKQKTPKDDQNLQNKFDFKFDENDQKEEDKTTYKAMGQEPCGNMTCFKYQVINPDSQDGTEYIWFDNSQYLLRKQEVTSGDGTTTSEFSYSGVNISEPSPTKDAKEGQVILPGGGMMPAISESEKKELENAQKEGQNMMQQLQNYTPPADSGYDDSGN